MRVLAALLLAAAPLSLPAAETLPPGVVVTTVRPGFALEKAGLQPGDVVHGWELRDQASGEIGSPIAFSLVEAEYEEERRATRTDRPGPGDVQHCAER